MWLHDPVLWIFALATALASAVLVALVEILPGRPFVFLSALCAAVIAVAAVVSLVSSVLCAGPSLADGEWPSYRGRSAGPRRFRRLISSY